MARTRNIWVLPEIGEESEEISKLTLGLLTGARDIAEKTGGSVTALAFGDRVKDHLELVGKYGVSRVYIFHDPLLQDSSAEACAAALLPRIQAENPWLVLMGHTSTGRDLAPRLAALLGTGVITNCARIELSHPEQPVFYRSIYGGQLYQEVVFETDKVMLATMNPEALNAAPASRAVKVRTLDIESKLTAGSTKTVHLEYLPADYQTVDVTDAATIVSAGMGAATDELLPLVEELAGLIEGAIGTTRPVVDGGKIPRERMIGQTGKVVSPEHYLALGISGATHHVGGIQESGKIVAVNRDPQAPIFQSADFGVAADLKEVLPVLIKRIKRAKDNGEIL
jgi:electron transfer flavoprotein alpha subunit